jgi:hypothetical protein
MIIADREAALAWITENEELKVKMPKDLCATLRPEAPPPEWPGPAYAMS